MNEELNNVLDVMEEDTQKGKFLTFSLGNEYYGIDIMYVTEIVGIQPITVVPELPDFIRGIINLRGKIIPVMDARLKFKKSPKEYNDRTCIIVVDVLDLSIGIIVDAVAEVLNISEDNIVPPPNLNSGGRKYIKSVAKSNDNVTLILDCEKLLNENELDELMIANE
ncbi:chemotaxis protein CheW [Lachnotalea glycerini]|jgi:purine-binding chemotaxis protein CheW|uniref:Chemotaxis protein CheW n=1 Tax=Lachnotalea glycerini TaxID=1763509 RepID=A0A371JJ88_9FIRM|nr:chemotaxis protein CheW [Lachnotalea glycerini]RDY32801.1 chemotaxis protein CheW [Lachnotalea glycerini]